MTESGLSIGSRVARGAAWMVSLRSADRLLGLVSTLILARLLFPEDFGLVAIAIAFSGTLAVFTEFGFDLALIQNQDAERRHYDTAWTFGVLRGVVISAILLFAAKPAAGIFGDARLSDIIMVFAAISLVTSFTNIGIVEFRKQLEFHKQFLFRFSSRFIGVMTTLTLAFLWRDYWALVAGLSAARITRFGLSYALSPYRPRFSLAGWHDLFHFSKWILLNGIITIGERRGSTFIIGAILTPAGVGLYSLGSEAANSITQAFVAPIKGVLFPGYAKLAHDQEGLKKILLISYGVIVLVAAPAAVGIGMTADLAVPILLGERWLDTIPIIEILVIVAFIQALQHVGPLLLALNRPNYLVYLSFFSVILLIPALLVGVWAMGIVGAAWATVGVRLAVLVTHYTITYRLLHISLGEFWREVWRSLAACALMALSVFTFKETFGLPVDVGTGLQALYLTLIVATGALTYIAGILLLWILCRRPADTAEMIVISTLRKALKMKKRT